MGHGNQARRRRSAVSDLEELGVDECQRQSEERRRWFREGRCPWCGELGPFVQGAPVCPTHGPYPFVRDPDEAEGLDLSEVEPEEPEE